MELSLWSSAYEAVLMEQVPGGTGVGSPGSSPAEYGGGSVLVTSGSGAPCSSHFWLYELRVRQTGQ